VQCPTELTPLDELFLQRAYELARRAIGNTSPNPPAGAVVVRNGRIVGEGFHHRAGDAHAEVNALAQAGPETKGATIYVSLEPCRHVGRTPPCTQALLEAGVARVVAGARDPTPHGGGAEMLRECGIDVVVAEDRAARELAEVFARGVVSQRPYVALKMATSLDGMVASRAGVQERIGSPEEERYVRELRITYDAVMVGAGTVRVDDPQLTVRPHHDRARPYFRVVAAQREVPSARSRLFVEEEGYARTILLVPSGRRKAFETLLAVADVIEVGARNALALDLGEAMKALYARGIFSVLCEGGPRLAASLLAHALVDRLYWAIAPRLLAGKDSVPVLSGADLMVPLRFDRVERLGPDVLISGVPRIV
jgi:diaminohydroxyphosphoribosylaminopyrimidine deaminase / 5-amino-6-(5-phosphoribosylamino)uracil reductase